MRNEPPKNNRLKTSYVLIYITSPLFKYGRLPPCNTAVPFPYHSTDRTGIQQVQNFSAENFSTKNVEILMNLFYNTEQIENTKRYKLRPISGRHDRKVEE
jgi:hypothetical protein